MALPSGTKLGPYEIQSPLGAGGMGEVYRALDTRLDRIVAIKVLPQHLSDDPLRRQRFEREARAISALQHPNICTLFDVGHQDGTDYLVMEYLDGQTLASRLTGGALPLEQTLRYGVEVADALDTAHRRGIVHRDLKPANIMLTAHGECKVLDFGLAKLGEEAPVPDAQTATRQDVLTSPGVALGTVAYMSPEQVRGEDLDARTDIFSLGTVLYEMASGKQPFLGKTSGLVFKAILDATPPAPTGLNSALPQQLDDIVSKALEKDRDLRYQSASDLRTDLKRVTRDTASARHIPAAPTTSGSREASRWSGTRWVAIAAVLGLVVGLGLWWYPRKGKAAPQFVERQLTTNSTEDPVRYESISPDGKYVVYEDGSGLHLRVISTGEEHDLALPSPATRMFITWFPDGNTILLTTIEMDAHGLDGTLWKVPVLGGTPTKLREHVMFPAVSPDGSAIAFITKFQQIWLMDAQGDNARTLFPPQTDDLLAALQWSPDGRYLAYMRIKADYTQGSIDVRRIDGGPASVIVADTKIQGWPALCWMHDWRLVYSLRTSPLEANLWATKADPATGRPIGNATQLTRWSGYSPASVSASLDGKTISTVKMSAQLDVYIGELSNQGRSLAKPQRFTLDDKDDGPDTWTPDSRALLIESDRNGVYNIYRQDLQKQKAEHLIGTPEIETAGATLTPDGAWILYASRPKQKPDTKPGPYRLMRVQVSGGSPELVLEGLPDQAQTGTIFACPRAVTSCIVTEQKDKGLIFYALDPLKGKGKELARSEIKLTDFYGWAVSPDGSTIAVVSAQGPFVRIIDLRTAAKRDVPVPGTWNLQSVGWSSDGKAVFATAWTPKAYLLARVDLSGQTQILKSGGLSQWMNGIQASPDGRYLAFAAQTWDSNVWLLQNF